jgi:hypothetical protein
MFGESKNLLQKKYNPINNVNFKWFSMVVKPRIAQMEDFSANFQNSAKASLSFVIPSKEICQIAGG